MKPRDAYERPKPLADLFRRIDVLTAKLGDPLLAAFEACEHLTPKQTEELYDLVLAEGAPLRCGALGFSARECDILQLLSARLQRPLIWQHVVITVDGVKVGDGRYVEETTESATEK
jgi:hypothetical protein